MSSNGVVMAKSYTLRKVKSNTSSSSSMQEAVCFVQQDIPVVRYIKKASMSTSNNGGCLVRIGFTADFYIKFLSYRLLRIYGYAFLL